MARRKQAENLNLGELQKVYRVKLGCTQLFLFGFVLVPWIFLTIGMIATGSPIPLIFIIPLSAAFFFLLGSYSQERHDEMRVYENGFTYFKVRKGLQTCFWSEIEYFIKARWNVVDGVRKKNGETIYWSSNMPGVDDLTADGRNKLMQF